MVLRNVASHLIKWVARMKSFRGLFRMLLLFNDKFLRLSKFLKVKVEWFFASLK